MTKYALDTNVLLDALNRPAQLEALLGFFSWALPRTFCSAIVLHELDAGTNTTRQRTLLNLQLAGPFARRGRVFAPSVEAWRKAGQLLQEGHRAPPASGLNDLLLALSCREAGLTLITRDRDFGCFSRLVRGLSVVAPYPERPSRGERPETTGQ